MTVTYPSFSANEEELEDYFVAHPELLGGLVVRRQPLTPCNGQPDVMLLDRTATLIGVELKRFSTCDKTIAQLLEYADWGDQLTMEDLTLLAAGNRTPIDLPSEFETHFGRPLPERLNGTPRWMLIASTFDRRTFHSVQYLQRRSLPFEALRYIEERGSIRLVPFTADDLHPRLQSPRGRASDSTQLRTRWLPSKYTVHEDVRCFWAYFSGLFVWEFVPFSFLAMLYEAWRASQEFVGRPRSRHQYGQFGRQLSHLAAESGEWIHHQRFSPGTLMDAREPLVDDVPNWARAAPEHPVAGYLRMKAAG